MSTSPQVKRRILVLTSHGIRTNAGWQKRLEEVVQSESEKSNRSRLGQESLVVTFRHNDYRYFSIFSFLNPFRRRTETLKFEKRLREYVASDEFDVIHLVGHSFGTHIIGRSLQAIGAELKGRIDTVILSGSVLRGSFPWDALFKTGIRRLVNDCGDRDFVLVLNAILPFGSGLAGRRGFVGITGNHFRNRFFDFGHSGYFEKRMGEAGDETWFMRKYWVPLLLSEDAVPYVDERKVGRNFLGWLVDQSENLKWLVPLGFAGILLLTVLYLALVWRTNFNLETLEVAGQVSDAVERRRLHGLEEMIEARQAAIDSMAGNALVSIESLFRDGARESLNPEQWKMARATAKFAMRRRRHLADEDVTDARPRGAGYIEITFTRAAAGLEDGSQRSRTKIFDLATAKPSDAAMWRWSGSHAGREPLLPRNEYGFAQLRRLNTSGLQGSLEQRFAASLSEEGAGLWDVDDAKEISSWKPASWGAAALAEIVPCGGAGDAIALTTKGIAYVLRAGGAADKLASPAPLVHIIGDRACKNLAAVTSDRKLVAWMSATVYVLPLPDREISSLEFSSSSELLLVNSTPNGIEEGRRADLLRLAGGKAESIGQFGQFDFETAVFSPTGRHVAVRVGDACTVRSVDALMDNPADQPRLTLACPKGADDAPAMARLLHFLDEDEQVLATRHHRGSFGDSHLEIFDLATQRSDWLARGSRYDIISLDATRDGTVITTTAGDSSGDGFGADRGFYVWSPFASAPVYEDGRDPAELWQAQSAWLSQDGAQAVVAWKRFDRSTEEFLYDVELVDLEPGRQALPGSAQEVAEPSNWGVGLGDTEFGGRPCEGLEEDASWAPVGASRQIERALEKGCVAGRAVLLRATVASKRAQVRIAEGEDGWALRVGGDGQAGSGRALQYADGTQVGDTIRDFISDPSGRRMFLSHNDGTITRLDFGGDLVARRIKEATGSGTLTWLDWMPSKQWLRVERHDPNADRNIDLAFYDADGQLMRHYDQLAALKIASGASGAFDAEGHYWTIADLTVGEKRLEDDPDLGPQIELLTERRLVKVETGETFSFGCDGEDYRGSTNVHDSLPTLIASPGGRFLGAGNLAPTVGAAENNTEMRLFDLAARKCLGVFRHGDEIYGFGISADGKLLVTQGYNETLFWHVPTHTVIHTVFGPARIMEDELGLRVVARIDAEKPGVWPIPSDLDAWLAAKP